MKIREIETYTFDELSNDAKDKAVEWWLSYSDYPPNEDNREVLTKFCDIFPVTVKNWKYGDRNDINYTIQLDDVYRDMAGVRLLRYLMNNYYDDLFRPKYIGNLKNKGKWWPIYSKCQVDNSYVLTGYCVDMDILEPIYKFIKKPDESVSFADLLNDCLWSWIYACRSDYEAYFSRESAEENIRINEYTFTLDGKRV